MKVEWVCWVYIFIVFSLNGDGRNDEFFIYGDKVFVNILVMWIFSCMGSLVFEWEDIMFNNNMMGWDGRFRGEEFNFGIFVYYVEIIFVDGVMEVFIGDVMFMW